MNPGKLRHRITVQKMPSGEEAKQDSYGQPLDEWVNVLSAWASIEPLEGREYQAAKSSGSELTHNIKVRYSGIMSELTTDMRIICGTRKFELISPPVNIVERNKELLLRVKERL